MDVETTNLDKGDCLNKDNKLLLITYHYQGEDHYIEGSEFDIPEWWFHLVESADFIVAHNAKFDLGWMYRAGLDISKLIVWDTMIAEYVLAGNTKRPLDLDSTLGRYGLPAKKGFISKSIKAGVCPSHLPHSKVLEYGIADTSLTAQLFQAQRAEIFATGLERTLYTHCLFTIPLIDIEAQGMQLDAGRVYAVHGQVQAEYDDVAQQMENMTPGVNFNSPMQLAALLYDELGFDEPTDRKGTPIRTATGRRKADVATLAMLRPRTAKQRKFLELQRKLGELGAKLEKALNKMVQCVEEDGGVLYAKFNQTITRTHRLSSTGKKYGIQFQNMFREFKPLFRAKEEHWQIGEGDGAQLEFRIAAWYGQDERATEDIKHGFDVHQFTADTLTEAKQATDRQNAKQHTFKPLFGGSSGTKAEQTYYKAFREKYPGITSTQERWITEVLRTKQLVLPTGMIFYWPDTELQPSGYVTNTTNISNYPIQYLATGEIIPIAVTYLWHRLRQANAGTKLVNTVHDSAIAEVHPEERELYEELVVQSFTHDVYNYLEMVYGISFNVPLEAEVKIQTNWSDSDQWRTKWLNKAKV